jgi:uncharacterized damage-inducible protein DinB
MLTMITDLVRHKWHANSAILDAIGRSEAASGDPAVLQLLHHILIANRFWLATITGRSFAQELELVGVSLTFADLRRAYQRTYREEIDWLRAATDADLDRLLEDPQIPGGKCSVREATLQVVLHTQGHRSQLATRLRGHGVTPPMIDFILWVRDRAEPMWT